MSKLAITFLVLCLSGCTSLPGPESLAISGNWQPLGFQDDESGKPLKGRAELGDLSSLDKQSIAPYKQGYW